MIDIKKILKRSWHILWNYRVLWVFGILLALTTGGGGGSSSSGYRFSSRDGTQGSDGYNLNFQPGPFLRETTDWFDQNVSPLFDHPDQHVSTFIWLGIAFLLLLLVAGVVAAFLRYVSETAAIRMVDEYEKNGIKAGLRQGWKLGWNRRAFRMWVIDLVISLPIIFFIAVLVAAGVMLFISLTNGMPAFAIGGTIAAAGCALFFILAFVALMVLLGLVRPFFVRAAALEGAGIGDSFRAGWAMFKNNWKSALLMWLVMFGIGVGYGVASALIFMLLIPFFLLLVLPAGLVAVIPGAIALGLTSIFASGAPAWIAALLVAAPFFLTILLAPMILVAGWYSNYRSSVWTLTYREMKALNAGSAAVPTPKPA